MSKCLIKDRNGGLLHSKRKPQEAASARRHHIQFMIKDYLQLLAKWTAMHSEENCPNLHVFRCGVYENGKSEAESTHPPTETFLKQ
jgi:hypothetical protein